ncbi:MAG TPA: molybdenum cofactor guanylyltransferase [Caldilineaceae bacterium]|nr:molybdenum cofactor guanylyltransferase [Caldilineaceae bacterium]
MEAQEDSRLSLLVNAGGRSRRMGRDKALLATPGGGSLLERVVRRLYPLASGRVVVVANNPALAAALPAELGVRFVADQWPDGGALGGLASGLAYCEGWTMAVACDMPFVEAALFRYLAEVAQAPGAAWDAVVPVVGGRAQVFHALYHVRSLDALRASLAAGRLAVREALAALRVCWVEEAALAAVGDVAASVFNANTPAEWRAAQQRMIQETNDRQNDSAGRLP